MDLAQNQIECQIAISHRYHGVDRVRISAPDEVAELLGEDVHGRAVVVLGRKLLQFVRDQIADSTQFLMAESIGGVALEYHLSAFEHRSFGDEHHRIVAWILVAIGHQQLRELLNVEPMLGDDTAVRCTSHGGQHRGEARIASEYFDHQKAFVRAGRGPQAVRHLDRAGDAGTEPDAIIGPRNIVVHGLGDGDDAHSLLDQTHSVTERVVTADGNQVVDAQKVEIFQYLRSQIVVVAVERHLQMWGNGTFLHFTGVGARTVQERSTGAPGPVNNFLGQYLKIVAIVIIFFANHVDQACPSPTHTDHLVPFTNRPDGHGTDCRVQAGYVPTPGQDSDHAFSCAEIGHSFLQERIARFRHPRLILVSVVVGLVWRALVVDEIAGRVFGAGHGFKRV